MTLLPPTAPHPHLSPRQLQVASYLYGLDTPNLEHATMLELGCNQGENLLSFAYSHPLAKAIGIDLDPDAITLGQQQLKNKGITNIELYTLDLAQLIQTDLPLYDYLIVRGLFAQTDLETRLQLLNHCRQFLSPNGVIVIEQAIYPGSKPLDGIFDSLALHCAQSSPEPEQQIKAMRAMLGFMANSQSSDTQNATIEQLEQKNDQSLYLSTLGGLHNPCYFVEFASQLETAQLCYVGDADPASELPERLGENINALTQLINPSQNKILTQQYLDTITQRPYRYSLITHAAHAEHLAALPNTSKLADLHWAGYFQEKTINEQLKHPIFETKSELLLQTPHPISQDIFYALGDAWPYSLDVKALVNQAAPVVELLDELNNPTAHQQVIKTLEQIFTYSSQHIYLSKQAGPYQAFAEKNPSNPPLSQLQFGATPTYINLWNESISIGQCHFLDNAIQADTIENINEIKELNKNGLLFISYANWRRFYFNSFKLLNSDSDAKNNISLIINKLINFSFPDNLFASKESIDYPNPNVSNKKVRDIQSHLNEDDHSFIKSIKKYKLTNKELAYAIYMFVDNKINKKQLNNDELVKRCIELDPYNYFYFIFFSYASRILEIKKNNYYRISRKIISLTNKDPLLLNNLAGIYRSDSFYKNAEILYKKSKELDPSNISNKNNLALTLSEQGKTDEALHELESMLSQLSFVSYSNYLFIAIHSNKYSPEMLFKMHCHYGELVEKWAMQQKWEPKAFHKSPHDLERPLRIGFVSGDLFDHAVAKFLLPYWEGLDSTQFHLYAYYTFNIYDRITQRLQEKAVKWTEAQGLNYVELAKVIRDDEIDILIDLSGHTGRNYLPTFALKPAPVQMTWIGYPATTGLKEMDYKITSAAYAKLDWMQAQFTEKLLYLDSTSAFDNTIDLPPLAETMPCDKNGYFTFASFNRVQKITDEALQTWAEIMQLCPNDKLLMANMPDDDTINEIEQKLIGFGAKKEQLLFKKRLNLADYMALHNEVDLLLDSFPYRAGTGTLHSISMGTATISLAGDSMVSYSINFHIYGLDDFLATSVENYKTKALLWRERTDDLLTIKRELREKFKNNNLVNNDAKDFLLFGKLLTYAWSNYLEKGSPESTIITY